MLRSFARYAAAATTLAAGGGIALFAVQAPAQAGGFASLFTCDVPLLGSTTVGVHGWLSSPGRTVVNRPASFRLHIGRTGVGGPLPVDSWSASAWINVTGAENTAFRVAGSGGWAPGQPFRGDLAGDWAPTVSGTDLLSIGRIKITVTGAATGTVTARCFPADRPVAETLTVVPWYPPAWGAPVAPYGPAWNRPIVVAPPATTVWGRPVVVVPGQA
jgi:hypothetical protein